MSSKMCLFSIFLLPPLFLLNIDAFGPLLHQCSGPQCLAPSSPVKAGAKAVTEERLQRTTSEAIGHVNCVPPEFHPDDPNIPQQVHLALTSKPGEMSISWITFDDHKTHSKGVHTFVEYWKMNADAVEAARSKKARVADRIRHEYSDTIDIKCSQEKKSKKWNQMTANIRYIHRVVLTGLEDNQRYGYTVGYCVPELKSADGGKKEECVCLSPYPGKACRRENRDKKFNFKMFPWTNTGENAFTFVVFGDLGLKKPGLHFKDEEGNEKKHLYDSLAPQSMQSLVELVHRRNNKDHPMLRNENGSPKKPHKVLDSHLDDSSSGLEMNEVQLILHIGDIAYDLHEWRTRPVPDEKVKGSRKDWGTKRAKKEKEREEVRVYNLGDRFMHIVEDVAAYVPYMVIAGNHENEEKKAERPDPPGAEAHFDPQYEHFESRFNMPRNFKGHDTNQYYHFTYGPIWFVCVSTEFYYSFSTPTWEWIPDHKKVREQFDFIEYSLIKANMSREKYPFVVVVQHRPFYCTSRNRFTCKDNKSHKNGIKDPDVPGKLVYGLEELYNRYHVDLVITGHEHIYEMFPPIQLHKDKNRVVPYKYWWHAKRTQKHLVVDEREWRKQNEGRTGVNVQSKKRYERPTQIDHKFMAFTDPVAPTFIIVGRPGNAEEKEQLQMLPHLQRIKQYAPFSITLVHYPGKSAKKSFLAVRQVDTETGAVPLEFALEKTFAKYDPEEICFALISEDLGKSYRSRYFLAKSDLIQVREQFTASEEFLKRRIKEPEEFSIHYLGEVFYGKTIPSDKSREIKNEKLRKEIIAGQKKKTEEIEKKWKLEMGKKAEEELEEDRLVRKAMLREAEGRRIRAEVGEKLKLVEDDRKDPAKGGAGKMENGVELGEAWDSQSVGTSFGKPRNLMSLEELEKTERDLLALETKESASANSKMRALLHAYNLRRWKPEDLHLAELYLIAKEAVCKAANYRKAVPNEERIRKMILIEKFDDGGNKNKYIGQTNNSAENTVIIDTRNQYNKFKQASYKDANIHVPTTSNQNSRPLQWKWVLSGHGQWEKKLV